MYLLIDEAGHILEEFSETLPTVLETLASENLGPIKQVIYDGDLAASLSGDAHGRLSNPVDGDGAMDWATLPPLDPNHGRDGRGASRRTLAVMGANLRDPAPMRVDPLEVDQMTKEEAWRRLEPWLPSTSGWNGYGEASAEVLRFNTKTAKASDREDAVKAYNPFTQRWDSIPASISNGLMMVPHRALYQLQRDMADAQRATDQHEPHPALQARGDRSAWRPLELRDGLNLCVNATTCAKTCLVYSGQNDLSYDYVVQGRTYSGYRISAPMISKARVTQAFLAEPVAFLKLVKESIRKHQIRCIKAGLRCFVRLNILSDIPFEDIYPELFLGWNYKENGRLRPKHEHVIFYDYTKVPGRDPNAILSRYDKASLYDLTFSYGGGKQAFRYTGQEVARGRRAAVVFFFRDRMFGANSIWKKEHIHEVYESFKMFGAPVVDGDTHDMRPFDPPETRIVGLWYKVPSQLKGQTPERVAAREKALSGVRSFLIEVEKGPIDGSYILPGTPRQQHGNEFTTPGDTAI